MCDRELAEKLYDSCKSKECKEAILFISDEFCSKRRQTLDLVDKQVSNWNGINKLISRYIESNEEVSKHLLFCDDIVKTMWNGYRIALQGIFRSAEENNSF